VALAGVINGVLAGLGIGWLIGATVAEGAFDEAEEEPVRATGHEQILATH
jgi:hypothetical protein